MFPLNAWVSASIGNCASACSKASVNAGARRRCFRLASIIAPIASARSVVSTALWAATRSAPYRVACRGPMPRGWPLCPERTGRAIRWRHRRVEPPRSSSSTWQASLSRISTRSAGPAWTCCSACPSQTGRCGSSCRMSWRTRALHSSTQPRGGAFRQRAVSGGGWPPPLTGASCGDVPVDALHESDPNWHLVMANAIIDAAKKRGLVVDMEHGQLEWDDSDLAEAA